MMTSLPDAPPSVDVAANLGTDQLLLPELKVRSGGAAHAKQLERRLGFLWQAAHALLPTNAQLAHTLTCVALADTLDVCECVAK